MDLPYQGLAEINSRLQFFVSLVFFFINEQHRQIDIFLCFILKLIYIKNSLCQSIYKAEAYQEEPEASGIEHFMT